MTEALLKQYLVLALKKELTGAVVFRHEDKFRAVIPDLSVTWAGKTTWIEVKFVAPRLRQKEIQDVVLKDLCDQGSALYVLYVKKNSMIETQIVNPLTKQQWYTSGFDHTFVARFIRDYHQP